MTNTLRRLNNTFIDIRTVLNTIDRNPRAEITAMKKQLMAALTSYPAFVEKVEEIKSIPALYQFAEYLLDELKTNILIETKG